MLGTPPFHGPAGWHGHRRAYDGVPVGDGPVEHPLVTAQGGKAKKWCSPSWRSCPWVSWVWGWPPARNTACLVEAVGRYWSGVRKSSSPATSLEEVRGCALESGIMILKQKTGPRKGAPFCLFRTLAPRSCWVDSGLDCRPAEVVVVVLPRSGCYSGDIGPSGYEDCPWLNTHGAAADQCGVADEVEEAV